MNLLKLIANKNIKFSHQVIYIVRTLVYSGKYTGVQTLYTSLNLAYGLIVTIFSCSLFRFVVEYVCRICNIASSESNYVTGRVSESRDYLLLRESQNGFRLRYRVCDRDSDQTLVLKSISPPFIFRTCPLAENLRWVYWWAKIPLNVLKLWLFQILN